MALATAHKTPKYEPQFTNTAGVQVVTSYVLVKADIPGEVLLGHRLMIAAVLIVTILVHGGAAISVGLGVATANGRSRQALAIAIGLHLLVVLVSASRRSSVWDARHPHVNECRRDPLVHDSLGRCRCDFHRRASSLDDLGMAALTERQLQRQPMVRATLATVSPLSRPSSWAIERFGRAFQIRLSILAESAPRTLAVFSCSRAIPLSHVDRRLVAELNLLHSAQI